ncbi:MAG TPA: NAD(P)-binding protein [Pseudolabrys sp.]|nr:NAD(P)-binding protein [Pseudolabrys sp.]
MAITRRDFLNGASLTIAAGLSPAAQGAADAAHYPPALDGLRGHHDGSFEVAHALRDGNKFSLSGAIEERYDLVVVGGGISGLAAAYFYRKAAGKDARILILDNHDDFGGHAKRNEFTIDGRLMLGYGGSESLQSPKALYSKVAKRLLSDLGVRIERFETAFDRKLYPGLGLKPGVFFAREAFGRDALVSGDPVNIIDSDTKTTLSDAELAALVEQFPMTAESKAQLITLLRRPPDYLSGKTADEKVEVLKTTSYRDYLMKICGMSEAVANFFQNRTHDFHGVGCDAVAASDARDDGYPGFAGLGLPSEGANPYRDEPYIYHFPDGNASLARLLVRALIPGSAPGHTMDDIVTARLDYSTLDRRNQPVRVRLNSTCINVHDTPKGAELAYVAAGKVHRVFGRHAILAGFNMMIPYIMPELPEPQRRALSQNVKAPLVYTNVLVRNWQAWQNLKVASIAAPMSYHSVVKLDYPVSLGSYRFPRDPREPMILHLVHVPCAPNQGNDARTQYRLGRYELLDTTFAQFEGHIRDDLDRMLGPGGFSSARDIAAITVNRWSHGYAYTASPLFDRDDWNATMTAARQRRGNVAIANADAGWDAYAHTAIDQASRAVHELLG